jgi:DNA-binding transcriptional LysR family regulator
VSLRITEFPDWRTLEGFVESGQADLAVGPRPITWSGSVRWVGNERFAVVAPATDRRAGHRGVDLGSFADSDWVLYAPEHSMRSLVLAACGAVGFTPQGVVETRQVDAAARLAAAGVGVALVPEQAIPADLDGHRVDLADPPVREVVAYARTSFDPPALAFVDILATLDIGFAR